MLCARVIRGSSSSAKSETPRFPNSAASLRLAQRVAQPDHHLTAAILLEVALAGLAVGPGGPDLQEDVGREDFGPRGDDLGPFVRILPIEVAGRHAGPGLDVYLHPGFDQRGHGGGDQGDAALAGEVSRGTATIMVCLAQLAWEGDKSSNHNKQYSDCKYLILGHYHIRPKRPATAVAGVKRRLPPATAVAGRFPATT